MKINMSAEMRGLDKAVARWKKVSAAGCKDIVTEAAAIAVTSASKHTSPGAGKSTIPAANYKRTVTVLHGKDGRKDRYKVPYRTAKKRGRKFFDKLKDAKAFARIKFRGMARAGWFLSLLKLGKNLTSDHQKMLNNSPQIANRAEHRVTIKNGINGRSITITNATEGISNQGSRGVAQGIRSAKNRINYLAKQLERQLKK